MKKLLAVFLLVALLFSVSCGGEEEPAPDTDNVGDSTTTSPALEATLTELGNMTYSIKANMCIGGSDKDGNPRLYCGINGDSYASFQIIDPKDGKRIRSFKLSIGKSVFELFCHSSGDIYVSAQSSSAVYRYSIEKETLELLMQIEQLPTAMCEDADGNVIIGLHGNEQFLLYDPDNNQIRQYSVPNMAGMTQYATAFNPEDGSYYVLSYASDGQSAIYRYTSLDARPTNILPEKYRSLGSSLFDINIIGDKLVCQTLGTTQQIMVLNARTGREYTVINNESGEKMTEIPCIARSISPLSPDGESFYFSDNNRKICRYDLRSNTYRSVAGLAIWSFVINWDYFTYPDGLYLIGLDGVNGDMIRFNIDKETVAHHTADLEGIASTLSSIDIDKNGQLFAASSVSGSGVYDTKNDKFTSYLGIDQVQDICATDRYVFYTRAAKDGVQVLAFDRNEPWNMTDLTDYNPSPVCTVSSPQFPQSETLGMLYLPAAGKLIVSTAPAEGCDSGAVCVVDTQTLDYTVKFDLVSGHVVKAMAESGGNVYLATTSLTGATPAQLVIYEPVSDRYTYAGDIRADVMGVYALTAGPDGVIYGVDLGYNLFTLDTAENTIDRFVSLSVASVSVNESITLIAAKDYLYMNCRGNQSLYAIRLDDLSLTLLKTSSGFDMKMAPSGELYFIRNFSLFKVTVKENV